MLLEATCCLLPATSCSSAQLVAAQQATCCRQQATCCAHQATCCGQQATCCPQQVARPSNLLPRNMLRRCKRGISQWRMENFDPLQNRKRNVLHRLTKASTRQEIMNYRKEGVDGVTYFLNLCPSSMKREKIMHFKVLHS